MGLYPDRGRVAERGPSGQSVDGCADSEGAWYAARAQTADVVAHVSAGALGHDRRRGLLHDLYERDPRVKTDLQ
jgi:hypothetical protein